MWLTKAHTSQEAPTSISGSSSLLDNDVQGIKAQEELYNKMKDLNLNVENTKVLGKYKGNVKKP